MEAYVSMKISSLKWSRHKADGIFRTKHIGWISVNSFLVDYPIHIDTISMELSILYFEGLLVKISIKFDIFLSLKIVFILANSADPDEMLPYAAFHLGLHCLLK